LGINRFDAVHDALLSFSWLPSLHIPALQGQRNVRPERGTPARDEKRRKKDMKIIFPCPCFLGIQFLVPAFGRNTPVDGLKFGRFTAAFPAIRL
jgi:hypothetical protein